MNLSADGLKLLMNAEGFRPRVYRDITGKETIGFGHRVLIGESFPNGVTDKEAEALLDNDVMVAEQAVLQLVHVPLTQGQFDALVDFVYNLGPGRLAESTLLSDLNAARYREAALQLLRWDCAAGRELAGLKARREAEVALWNGSGATTPQEAA
jgi:lysozyme